MQCTCFLDVYLEVVVGAYFLVYSELQLVMSCCDWDRLVYVSAITLRFSIDRQQYSSTST